MKRKYLILILIFFFLFLPSTLWAATPHGKVVIIVVNFTDIEDLSSSQTPYLFSSFNRYGSGLMNTKTNASNFPSSAYLSIGSSSRTNGTEEGGTAYSADEAKDLFYQRTGISLSQGIVNLSIAPIIEINQQNNTHIIPGLLGSTLEEMGLKTAVLGNADTKREVHREISLIAMNKEGIVPLGRVDDSLLIEDRQRLSGYRTNYPLLLESFSQYKNKADLMAIETGDTSRIYYESPYADEEVVNSQRKKALKEIDNFVSEIAKRMDLQRDLLIVVSPSSSYLAAEKEEIWTPLIISGKGFEKGLLISASTRIKGVITNEDIAPTILKFFQAKIPYQMEGKNIFLVQEKSPYAYLFSLNNQNIYLRKLRFYFIYSYVLIISLFLLFCFLVMVTKRKISQASKKIIIFISLFLLSIPLVSIILSLFKYTSLFFSFFFIALGSLIVSTLAYFMKKNLLPLTIISLATALLIIIDTILGNPLMVRTIFGNDIISGSRFYGIGNVPMGFLIGAVVIGLLSIYDSIITYSKRHFWLILIILAIMCFIIGYPQFGSNAGGLITAIITTFITMILLAKKRITAKFIIYSLLSAFLILILFLFIDLYTPLQSHFGKTLILLQKGGLSEWIGIAYLKLKANIYTATKQVWGYLAILGVIFYLFFFLREKETYQDELSKSPFIYKGLIALAYGAIIGFLSNDTGISVAGTMLLFVLLPFVYIHFHLKLDLNSDINRNQITDYRPKTKDQSFKL